MKKSADGTATEERVRVNKKMMSPYSNWAVRISLELKILVNYLKVPDFALSVAVYQKNVQRSTQIELLFVFISGSLSVILF